MNFLNIFALRNMTSNSLAWVLGVPLAEALSGNAGYLAPVVEVLFYCMGVVLCGVTLWQKLFPVKQNQDPFEYIDKEVEKLIKITDKIALSMTNDFVLFEKRSEARRQNSKDEFMFLEKRSDERWLQLKVDLERLEQRSSERFDMNNDLFRNLVDKVSGAQAEIQRCVGSMSTSIEHIKDNIESVTTEVTKHAYELGALQGKHAPGRTGK